MHTVHIMPHVNGGMNIIIPRIYNWISNEVAISIGKRAKELIKFVYVRVNN